ncbi:MAG: hypothetical protein NTV46_07760 [Verrucomicrobia bacterium]|nr:hypothetical protein [Verrucomicrobiota bacterium]
MASNVAVDQSGSMGGFETLGRLNGQRQHFRLRDFALIADFLFEVAAGHEFHGNIEVPESPPGPQHPHDIRVAEGCRDACFLLERRDSCLVGGKRLAENFHRHFTVQCMVAGGEDHAHAAHRMAADQRVWAEFALDPCELAADRALHVGKRCQRRDIHRIPTCLAGGDGFRMIWHACKLPIRRTNVHT